MDKSITLNAALKWSDVPDDYVVRYQGHEIGWIRRSSQSDPEGQHWEWMIVVPMALPSWSLGRTASRDSGLRALAAAWQKLLKETSPERIERMWELERAVAIRQSRSAQPHCNSASPAAQLLPAQLARPSEAPGVTRVPAPAASEPDKSFPLLRAE